MLRKQHRGFFLLFSGVFRQRVSRIVILPRFVSSKVTDEIPEG